MKKLLARLRRHSPAMIVAMLALFVALSGTAVATTSALITGRQIAKGTITGAHIKKKTLTPRHFKGSVRGARGAPGQPGAKGDKGDTGPPGAPNPNAVNAENADKLDGLDSNTFSRAGASASAATRLIDQDTHNCTSEDGPSVTVNVGPSGLVAVYAEAAMGAGSTDPGRELRVQLHEATTLASCETILKETNVSSTTNRTLAGGDGGTTGRGTWLVYRVAPGERTFSLRYGHTGNGFGILAIVQARYLYVQPL